MKKLSVLVLLSCISLASFAQREQSSGSSIKDKLFAGGNFGLSIGSYTLVSLSPQIGYRFNKFISSGLGLNFQYASQKEKDAFGNDYRKVVQGVTGLNVFARFYPIQKFILQIQPEGNYVFGKQIFYQPTKETYKLDTEIIPSVLVGGGLAMPTANGSFLTTIMYDILQDPSSPYGKRPIINVGYNFNF